MREIILLNRYEKALGSFKGVKINCMRPHLLGNPFIPKDKSDDERRRVIAAFRVYLWKKMQSSNPVNMEIRRLASLTDDIALICCCKPKECHTDIIKSAIGWLRSQ